MKIQDFSKLYGALVILSIVVILRPGKPALEIMSQPILPFSLLAFFLHRGSYQNIPAKGLVNLALGLLLISFLGLALFPQKAILLHTLWACVHLLLGVYYVSVLRRPIAAPILAAAIAVLIMGWIYALFFYSGSTALDYTQVLFLLALSFHGFTGLLIMLRMNAWSKLLALGLIFWLLADGASVLYPEWKQQVMAKSLIYGGRALAMYGTVLTTLLWAETLRCKS